MAKKQIQIGWLRIGDTLRVYGRDRAFVEDAIARYLARTKAPRRYAIEDRTDEYGRRMLVVLRVNLDGKIGLLVWPTKTYVHDA